MNYRALSASGTCRKWADDWGGLLGTTEPSPSQIIRAMASQGWSGHRRTPRCITNLELYASAGSFKMYRPRKIKSYPDGGMSMLNEPGVNPYAPMANIESAKRLVARYQRFCTYMRDGRHDWQFVRDVHYADNSTERVEVSRLTGETRQYMTTAPSGDACW